MEEHRIATTRDRDATRSEGERITRTDERRGFGKRSGVDDRALDDVDPSDAVVGRDEQLRAGGARTGRTGEPRLIGKLFGGDYSTKDRTELVFFLTPHVITDEKSK